MKGLDTLNMIDANERSNVISAPRLRTLPGRDGKLESAKPGGEQRRQVFTCGVKLTNKRKVALLHQRLRNAQTAHQVTKLDCSDLN